jgi:hypothetical protein
MTPMPLEQWKRAFLDHIVTQLTDHGWEIDVAKEAAANELNGLDEPIDTTEDPAGAADDSLSYWEGGE